MFEHLVPWLRGLGIDCRENAAIGPFLNFKIGGQVSLLAVCTSPAQLAACWQRFRDERIPFLVIGGGSNIVFHDGLTRAAVLVYLGAA
jgi:UDP-N-acetylenolpyruvoylglucosamine reductase